MGMSMQYYHALYLVYRSATGRLLVPSRVDASLDSAQRWALWFRRVNRYDREFVGTVIRREVAQ